MEIWLIRHGKTLGNRLHRYIGRTEEGLSDEGKEALRHFIYPKPERIFCSPMQRCRETAQILFPGVPLRIVPDLREMDFGIFENRSAAELAHVSEYQKWVDSFCEAKIPGGEKKRDFQRRTEAAFSAIVEECGKLAVKHAAVVAHGGTLMSVLDAFSEIEASYYEWNVGNGGGYHLSLDWKDWKNGRKKVTILEKRNP